MHHLVIKAIFSYSLLLFGLIAQPLNAQVQQGTASADTAAVAPAGLPTLHQAERAGEGGIVSVDEVVTEHMGVLRGEILSFNEFNGLLVFKDRGGRVYTFTSKEYRYFRENVVIKPRALKMHTVHQRKTSGTHLRIGLGTLFLGVAETFAPDANYVSAHNNALSTQTLAHVAVLKSLNEHELFGVKAAYGLITSDANYTSLGFQYQHYFDALGSATFYLPLSLAFASTRFNTYYSSSDTTFFPGGGSLYPTDVQGSRTVSAAELGLGVGVLRALKNQKSVAFEAVLFRQFGTSTEQQLVPEPQSEFLLSGLKFLLAVGF